MESNSLLKNSSLFIAYMGCLGWGSAYFYGWGVSYYYGFPWWIVGAGVDDVARSLFYAVTVMGILLIGWGVGVVFFFGVKLRSNIQDLSFLRLFLAVFLVFIPMIVEFSFIKQGFVSELSVFFAIIACAITVLLRLYGSRFSLKFISQNNFIKRHLLELVMAGFVTYFWIFAFVVGYYKPQFKKEYEMIYYKERWYYVLSRNNDCLVLSSTFGTGSKRYTIFKSEHFDHYEISIVHVRL